MSTTTTAPRTYARQQRLAERLTKQCNGAARVKFEPEASDSAEGHLLTPASKGHLYWVNVHCMDFTELWLDDREPLGPQLAQQLRAIASELNKIAKLAEGGAK